MPAWPRRLPDRPSLRYLRLEAKRRHASGEFPGLHDAQHAIAREYGLASWAQLKQLVDAESQPGSPVLDQVRWIIGRFRDADQPGWMAPDTAELGQHFDGTFLEGVPGLAERLAGSAADMRAELVVERQRPLEVRATLDGLVIHAVAAAAPPHRLIGLAAWPVGAKISDGRLANAPPARGSGPVPAGLTELADEAFAELGLPGLAVAGGDRSDTGNWVVTVGWADLDRAEPLLASHQFPAPGISVIVAAVAVLRLIGQGRCGLDDRVNTRLKALRLADGAITIRDLLSHSSGLGEPAELFAGQVPDQRALLAPVAARAGARGTLAVSNGGIGVLGLLVADLTGLPFVSAADRLVMAPLGMRNSVFPARAADLGPGAVTGYELAGYAFTPAEPAVCTIPAAGGLWSTPADLVRLSTGWTTLLPDALAAEAVRPQAVTPGGGVLAGLGWLLSPDGERAFMAGATSSAAASLVTLPRDGRTHVTLATRPLPLADLDERIERVF